jgi:tellurite resistance protein TerC
MPPDLPSIGSPMFYGVFTVAVLVMIAVDMVVLNQKGSHRVGLREALTWTVVWIAVSVLFAGWLGWVLSNHPRHGPQIAEIKVLEFFTGYVIEKALAVDNLFVFLMVFSYFKVPLEYQRRVLVYGVLGAIVLRAILVGIGALLVAKFAWILYIFGAFLLFTGIKMLLPEKRVQTDLTDNLVLRFLRTHLRLTPTFHGEQFFVIESGVRYATPLFLVLVMIDISDMIFAVDSIPAIFAVTTDPFIVLTSNIFAILGLRAMYFLLADVAERFHHLKYGLAAVLTFIGIKMLIVDVLHISVGISLGVVFTLLIISILTSLAFPERTPHA